MKKIEAIIQPHFLDKVREALVAVGVQRMTISEAQGYVAAVAGAISPAAFDIDFHRFALSRMTNR
jgi:nitrogen regulatory protein PII